MNFNGILNRNFVNIDSSQHDRIQNEIKKTYNYLHEKIYQQNFPKVKYRQINKYEFALNSPINSLKQKLSTNSEETLKFSKPKSIRYDIKIREKNFNLKKANLVLEIPPENKRIKFSNNNSPFVKKINNSKSDIFVKNYIRCFENNLYNSIKYEDENISEIDMLRLNLLSDQY